MKKISIGILMSTLMLKEKNFSIALIMGVLFISIYLNNTGIHNNVVHKAYGHSFTPNDYASFIASIDQFQTELNLVQSNIANNNLTLAQVHADKASSLYVWKLMGEIAEKDQKTAEEITKAVKTFQNMSSSAPSVAEPQQQQQMQQQVNQLVADVDTKTNEIITMTMRQQESDSSFLDPIAWLVSSIFGEKKDNDNSTTQPLRVAELVDGVLRSYGNAYDVGFDMTNMSNMAMTSDDSSMSMSNMMSGDDNGNLGMDHMNMSSSAMMNGGGMDMSNNYTLANAEEYQSAQALAAKALDIFNNELKPMKSDNDSTVSISKIENGLIKLNDSIKDKASPMDVMMIVHTQIHPNLLEAFNIPLKSGA